MAAIFLIILVDFLGFGLIIPLLPFLIPNYADNPIKVGLIFSIYSICQFIGAPVLGALSDRYGRRPILIISQIGSAIGYVMLGIAAMPYFNGDPTMRLVLVYASRIIDGFTGGNVSTAQAYISDITPPHKRARAMGMVGAAFGIGFSLGPALGGGLGRIDMSWPGYAAALLALAAAVQTWLKLPESPARKATEVQNWLHPSTFLPVFKKPVLAQLLYISMLSMTAFVMMEAVIAIFLASAFRWDDAKLAGHNTGLFLLYVGVVIVIVQGGLIGRLTKKLGEWPLAIWGPILVAIGMGLYAWVAWLPTMGVLLAAGAVNAIGRSLQQPTVSSLLSKHSSPDEQGLVFGLYHGLSSIARVVGPILAGLLYPLARNTGPFWGALAIASIAAVWTIALRVQASTPVTPELSEDAQARAARTEVE